MIIFLYVLSRVAEALILKTFSKANKQHICLVEAQVHDELHPDQCILGLPYGHPRELHIAFLVPGQPSHQCGTLRRDGSSCAEVHVTKTPPLAFEAVERAPV